MRTSEPEFANARLVKAEVVTDLMAHRLDDLRPQALGIIAEVAHERVAKNQDLFGRATAPEEGLTTPAGSDVHAVCVVLGTAVGDDDRHVLERALELDRQFVERCADDLLELLLAVVPVLAHGFVIAPGVARARRSEAQTIEVDNREGIIGGSSSRTISDADAWL